MTRSLWQRRTPTTYWLNERHLINNQGEVGLSAIGTEGARFKQLIANDRIKAKPPFDLGMYMLGTDNEADAVAETEGMLQARKAS